MFSTTAGGTTIEPLAPPPFPQAPGLDLTRDFRKHVTETGRPETFRGVIQGRIDPEQGHVFLSKFEVAERFKADGGMIPCSICCSEKPKYWNGILIWSPDGYLRLIGHKCGRNTFGDRKFGLLSREMMHKRRLSDADQYLIEHYAEVKGLHDFAVALRRAAFALRNSREKLQADVSNFCRFLERQHKQGLGLPLYRKTERQAGGPSGIRSSTGDASDTQEYSEQPIRGIRLFGKLEFDPVEELNRFIAALPPEHPISLGMENYVFAAPEHKRIKQAETLRNGKDTLSKLRDEMIDARTFLTTSNIQTLDEWLHHPDCVYKFLVRLEEPAHVVFKGNGRGVRVPLLDGTQIPLLPF